MSNICRACDEAEVSKPRLLLGYKVCLKCGERDARQVVHTIVPMHKSNYVVISNYDELVSINTKGG